MAIRSLGVVCWAGLVYRKHCPVVLLLEFFVSVRLAIQGQGHLRRVPCQRGSSASLAPADLLSRPAVVEDSMQEVPRVPPASPHSLSPSTPTPGPMSHSSCATCVSRAQTVRRPLQTACPGRACPGSTCSRVSASCHWLGRRWVSEPLLAFWLACDPGTASGGGQPPKDRRLLQATQLLGLSQTEGTDWRSPHCRVKVGRLRPEGGLLRGGDTGRSLGQRTSDLINRG